MGVGGQTALTITFEYGSLTCVTKVVANERTSMNPSARNKKTALSFACSSGADEPDISGATPFFPNHRWRISFPSEASRCKH